MLIQLLISLLLGTLAGTITGLIPGIHINLIGALLVSLSSSVFNNILPIYLIVFIASMAITHTFLDFIPSIFLGCPDTDTELSTLPGHELLKKGQGYQAIILTAYGSLAAIFIIILISFPSILIIKKTYSIIQKLIPFLLILISIFLIFSEKKKFSALIVFLLTGILGFSVLNLELKQPLLPLLTGLFGSSMLIITIKNKTQIPPQKIEKPKTKITKPLIASLISAPLCSFLPGLGSGQAAIIGSTILNKDNKKQFLILLGATNTLVMGFSFISLYTINKTRTGAAKAIQEIFPIIQLKTLILLLIIIFLSGIISFYLTIKIAKFFSLKIHKTNYTFLSILTLLILIIVVYSVSGASGLIILVISTITGIYSISTGVRRTNMMGSLLLPTIIFYLRIF